MLKTVIKMVNDFQFYRCLDKASYDHSVEKIQDHVDYSNMELGKNE